MSLPNPQENQDTLKYEQACGIWRRAAAIYLCNLGAPLVFWKCDDEARLYIEGPHFTGIRSVYEAFGYSSLTLLQ